MENIVGVYMITDVYFYMVAIPAVLIYGIAKGGFGGALGVISVPIMCFVVSPQTAASILLPILCVMDLFAVSEHRRNVLMSEIKFMLPPAVLGIVLASLFMGMLDESFIAIFIGLLSLAFSINYFLTHKVKCLSNTMARVMCVLSGVASTAIHSGGAPISIYIYPKGFPKRQLMGTLALFFCLMNLIKLVPYSLLGGFNTQNLLTSLVLMPLAPIGVKMGVYLLDKIDQKVMYNLCYGILFLSGIKLILT
ncbi:sulfite exporter TauE/SafE family protein [Vibrio rarus]|uniref:sulfite exporter TauE/SafE family protein n=1 Tax=Vibrio rarus TaxID=413403 RepID=UPI0021C34F32|nr:sulfite exporter TauE/SafE family protein [Vibrio rarus]